MGQALGQHGEEVQFPGRPLDHADLHDAPVHGGGLEVPRHIVAGDDVDDDVHALACGGLHHRFDEVLLLVVDRDVGAEAQAGLALLLAAHRGDDLRGAEGLGQHGRGCADAGGATVDQQGLALPEPAALEQVDPDGHEGFR
ncbi:hypothetical protein D9M70_513230 [compost metagenome]